MIQNIVVAGAGTMGSGISLAAAQGGSRVVLYDTNEEQLQKARASVQMNLDFLLKKGKISIDGLEKIRDAIKYTNQPSDCTGEIIIEAIIEQLAAKTGLLTQLAAFNNSDVILASNTSSLSITALQDTLPIPENVAGIHFFNPAHIMKLVEVVKGEKTTSNTIDKLLVFSKQINKSAVVCNDAPGFIVNRVARHFYLESLYLVENGLATPEAVDAAMEVAGFKMGPFKLMDLIGMDINNAVSESLYRSFNKAIRFTPSAIQQQKVKEGNLGRKTGKGFYTYSK